MKIKEGLNVALGSSMSTLDILSSLDEKETSLSSAAAAPAAVS